MPHDPTDLRNRTKMYALRIIKLFQILPKSGEAQVGAQYREACRAKSPADFINKMEGSLQELDETSYWLELLAESKIMPAEQLANLQKENDELTAIFVTSVKTAKRNRNA
jgi:four helix bundle protein